MTVCVALARLSIRTRGGTVKTLVRLRIDALLDGQRGVVRIGLAHQPGVPGMRLGIEREPVEWVAAAGERGKLVVAEIGQGRARCGLRCGDPGIARLDGKPAGNDVER